LHGVSVVLSSLNKEELISFKRLRDDDDDDGDGLRLDALRSRYFSRGHSKLEMSYRHGND